MLSSMPAFPADHEMSEKTASRFDAALLVIALAGLAAGTGLYLVGKPDLARTALALVRAPTLLIVGALDEEVIRLNVKAAAQMPCEHRIEIVPGATHLFEEPGALDEVTRHAAAWFGHWLGAAPDRTQDHA